MQIGVATSITAFLGRTVRGPVNEGTNIASYADFERIFGGLKYEYPMSYSVRDFFQNGGEQAVIVRLYHATFETEAKTDSLNLAKSSFAPGSFSGIHAAGLQLRASSQGSWGNDLKVTIEPAISQEIADRLGVTLAELFNLNVQLGSSGPQERFTNLSIGTDDRNVANVLKAHSQLIQVEEGTQLAIPVSNSEFVVTDFADDGKALESEDYAGVEAARTGQFALEETDLFNILCIPEDQRGTGTQSSVYEAALTYCNRRRAMLLVDPHPEWESQLGANNLKANPRAELNDKIKLSGSDARNAAIYFPRIRQADPERAGQIDTFVPCGMVAGIMARTDATHGVWKAPAGLEASIIGIDSLSVKLTKAESSHLNAVGINCLRSFPALGNVVWGARTLRGDDQIGDEYKYILVRRTALFIEESVYRGTQWVVFEPNDEPLWAQIRLNVGEFMHDLFRQGAFQGSSPREAYFVSCGRETTTQTEIDRGILNIVVGFAPLKPAEFVVIKLTQAAGQIEA